MGTTSKKLAGAPKFQIILAASGQDLLDRRSQLIYSGAEAAMTDHITALRRKRDSIEFDILNLTDLSVKTTHSLTPGNKDFEPVKWVAKMCDLQKEIELINDDIDVAEKIQKEYFTATKAAPVADTTEA